MSEDLRVLKVIVVEDDVTKLGRVRKCLEDAATAERESIEIDDASDARTAKQQLRASRYDLMVLDITLPERRDEEATPYGGIALFEEVLRRDMYMTPQHIVGLTAFDEVVEGAARRFADDLWSVIKYDITSDEWERQLGGKMRHILVAARGQESLRQYATDVCVITALADPELQSVLRLPWRWERIEVPNDPSVYHKGHFIRGEREGSVVAACTPRMGMTAAAILSMKMIAGFCPRYLAMVGILAGVKGRCQLGDILAADPSWDWGSGKQYLKDGSPIFSAAPHQAGLNAAIRSRLSLMAQQGHVLDEIRRGWDGQEPSVPLRMHLGPIASGAAVLEDPHFTELIMSQHRKVIGIDMESYAVLAAAEECSLPQPKAFSLKSVCDFADPTKDDSMRKYASYTSAAALRVFVERYL